MARAPLPRADDALLTTIEDEDLEVTLPIDGLQFEANLVKEISGPKGWFTRKVLSSEGPLISDFVTHEIGFTYNSYGIHVGQEDRLTFMGTSDGVIDEVITGHFIDCRAGSTTLHRQVSAQYRPSLLRRLIVPRGVAHTFDGLAGIVTRDEPIWYADFDNADWDVNNDLVSVPRTFREGDYPVVRINEHRMPDGVHRFVSRLSQSLLETPTAYASRHLLRIGSEDMYVMFQPKNWTDEKEIESLLDVPEIPGVGVRRSRYALTGPKSWTLVPNTGACVVDVLVLPSNARHSANRFLHRRTRKWYTVLTNPGCVVGLETVDYRPHSSTFGFRNIARLTADPRISFWIEPGVAYSFSTDVELLVRCEHEVFVAPDEPRSDLPGFGADLIVLSDDREPAANPELPRLRCPDEVVRRMARAEQETMRMG